jgi:hypothetical protein
MTSRSPLLDADPAIRWRVMQDLAPPEAVDTARREVASKGWVRIASSGRTRRGPGPVAYITSMYVGLATYLGLDDTRVDRAQWA